MSNISGKQADQLQTLVGIKRQKAEQEVWSLQQQVRQIEDEMSQIDEELKAFDAASETFDGASLARRHGAVERMIGKQKQKKEQLAARRVDLEAAREALKRVLHSEDQIGDL